MKFTKNMIDDLADKLLIGLTNEENDMVLKEFDEIEANMNLINEIANIDQVEAMTYPFSLDSTVLREDHQTEELTREDVLRNATNKTDKVVIVPKVVGE